MLIPRSRIPKIIVMCPICESGDVATRISSPYADGYYRRHVCTCGAVFHTLTPYDGRSPEVSAKPFKDRELSEYEAYTRAMWWKQEASALDITFEVTLLTRLTAALDKEEKDRTDVEKYITGVYHALERKVRDMETPKEGDQSDG